MGMNRQVRLVAGGFVVGLALSGCGLVDLPGLSAEPGTRVELVATPSDDSDDSDDVAVTPETMDAAVAVMEAADRTVSDVVVDEGTITLGVTGELSEETRALISEPGALSFRPVLVVSGAEPDGGPQGQDRTGIGPDIWSQFEALDCADPVKSWGDPDLPLVTCDKEGTAKYVLGPVEVDGAALSEVTPGTLAGAPDDWGVHLRLDDRGSIAFQKLTERLQGLEQPRNQAAITLDGLVISAPSIQQGVVIANGDLQISGSFTEQSADVLAHQLSSDPLPFPFEVRDVSEAAE